MVTQSFIRAKRVTLSALVADQYTFELPRKAFILFSESLWDVLVVPIFVGVGQAGFKSGAIRYYWPKLFTLSLSFTVFHFSSSSRAVGIVGLGSSE